MKTTMNKEELPEESTKSEEESNELTTFTDPRAEQMKLVVDQATENREDEQLKYDEDPMDEEDEVNIVEDEAEVINDNVEDIVDNIANDSNNEIIERDGKRFILLNVNGVSTEMPLDAAKVALQKMENADQLMHDAAKSKKQYETLIAQHTDLSTPADENPQNAVDTRERLNDALTKVYDGEVDEAADIFEEIFSSTKQPKQSQDHSFEDRVDARVAQIEDHKTLRKSYDSFMSDENFKVVTKDPVLLERVNAFTDDLQRDSEFMKTKPSYTEIFEEAGTRTKKWLEQVSGTTLAAHSTEEQVDSRLERKRQAPSNPKPRTVRRGTPKDEKPFAKSTDEIIRGMAKRRGQTNL